MSDNIFEQFLYKGSLFLLPGEMVFNSSRSHLVQGFPSELAIAKGVLDAAKAYLPQLKGKYFAEIAEKFGTHLEEVDAYEAGIIVGMNIALGTVCSITSNMGELTFLFYEAQARVDGLPYFAFLQTAITRGVQIFGNGPDSWKEIISLAHGYRTDLYYRVGITVGEISFRATRLTFEKLVASH